MWHSGPVDLVADVAYGPRTVFEFPPEPGQGFARGDLDCRLVAVVGNSSFYFGSPGTGRVRLHLAGENESSRATAYVFLCQPTAANLPVHFEFLDSEGNVLRGSDSSTPAGHFLCIYYTNHPPERVARIRAKVAAHVRRVVIHLPRLPGLPEVNRNVKNLFDVRIPFVRFKNADEIQYFLIRILGMQFSSTGSRRSGTNPGVLFPAEFTDASIRDIARFYAKAQGGYLRMDKTDNTLSVVHSESPLEKLSRLLRTIRSRF
jgi:hypothetical protein